MKILAQDDAVARIVVGGDGGRISFRKDGGINFFLFVFRDGSRFQNVHFVFERRSGFGSRSRFRFSSGGRGAFSRSAGRFFSFAAAGRGSFTAAGGFASRSAAVIGAEQGAEDAFHRRAGTDTIRDADFDFAAISAAGSHTAGLTGISFRFALGDVGLHGAAQIREFAGSHLNVVVELAGSDLQVAFDLTEERDQRTARSAAGRAGGASRSARFTSRSADGFADGFADRSTRRAGRFGSFRSTSRFNSFRSAGRSTRRAADRLHDEFLADRNTDRFADRLARNTNRFADGFADGFARNADRFADGFARFTGRSTGRFARFTGRLAEFASGFHGFAGRSARFTGRGANLDTRTAADAGEEVALRTNDLDARGAAVAGGFLNGFAGILSEQRGSHHRAKHNERGNNCFGFH